MCGSTVDIQSPTAEIRREKKKKKKKEEKNHRAKYNGHNYLFIQIAREMSVRETSVTPVA